LARFAREQFQLNEVIFVLPKFLPNKPLVGVSLEQRLEMMQLAVGDVPYISIGLCTHGLFLEICTALEQHYSQRAEIFFITGRDAAERILTWPYDDPAAALSQMFGAFQLLIYEREGKPTLPQNTLIKKYANRMHILDTEKNLDHISSTKVRQRMHTGQSIQELVPPEVASYIIQHDLYKNEFDQDCS
jgi:nicotinate-nucleotide adenylyltransferase